MRQPRTHGSLRETFNAPVAAYPAPSRERKVLYPVYVHKDENSAYGAIVPDMPGVHTAVDTLDELPAALQEAVELMYEGNSSPPPRATTINKHQHAQHFKDGFWMLVDIAR